MSAIQKEAQRVKYDLFSKDLIPCSICGKKFRMVCRHAVVAHGISAREYKMQNGLPLSVGVVGPEYRLMVTENNDLLKEKKERLSKFDRSLIPVGSHKGKYVPSASLSHKQRAKEHREKTHKDAVERWASIRTEFTEMWLNGTPVKQMCIKFNVVESQIKLLRNVFGLPSRVFSNWIKPVTIIERDHMTVRESIAARKPHSGIDGTPQNPK